MSEEIIYQINGQLTDNMFTVDNKEDMLLVPLRAGAADEERILSEMQAEDSGLHIEILRHVHSLEKRVVKRLLMSGYHVNNGLYHAAAAFRGIIDGGKWNPEKNSIVVNFNVGADLREAIRQTKVNIVGTKASPLYIGGMKDMATGAQNATATAGRAFTLVGQRLKIVGGDPAVGIALIASDGTETRVPADLYVTNMPTRVTFIIPAGLADGVYTLRLSTQYGSNSKTILKAPRSVEKTITIGLASDTAGGGTGGDGGGAGSDPLE